MLALAGCSRGDDTASTTVAPPPTAASTTSVAPLTTVAAPPAPTAPPTTAAVPVSTVTLPDPNALLAAALDAAAPGYHFITTASVGDQVVLSAEGDHAGGATRMTLTSLGATTDYIVTADAAWALQDGEWQELDQSPGLADPLSPLRTPTSIELLAGNTEAATLLGHYPAAALGLPGDTDQSVTITIATGQLTALAYSSTANVTAADGSVSQQPAAVTTQISALAPGTAVTLPPD